ncbi:RbsD/FucU family protein [Arcanobacterium phocae]|uniref:RbsD/FucU family protein n=1 Tax=Arcanobacterium phocae TaxID=131112 RepID=UPI001C0F0D0E|nr:RbsD/FucU domain-containing protein [Arcanobacterium phocae]
MLRNIPAVLSPEIVYALMRMGHGDTLVIADANFPGHTMNDHVIRADGLNVPELLDAILQLMPLDPYNSWQVGLMDTVEGDPQPEIWKEYTRILDERNPEYVVKKFERFAFYDESKKASTVIMSGETALYANIILTKGVIV